MKMPKEKVSLHAGNNPIREFMDLQVRFD
jgi:hypothetical protein